MANPEHIEIVKAGAQAIADWRKQHPYDPLELSDADLSGTDFTGSNLMWSRLAGANMNDATLVETNLTQADLTNSRLNRVDFSRADLKLSNLRYAKLRGANLTGASLVQTELTNADLSRANLELADLSLANITGGDLSYSQLYRTDLNGADLREANLKSAQLIETNLRRANLERANLFGATVSRAYLEDTNFDQAECGATNWLDLNFSTVKNLDTVRHRGSSAISVGSIFRSGGSIVAEFLRGCGLPESFITALPNLPSLSLQYYSCFITFNHKDEEFAARLHAELRKRGIRCWLDKQPIDVRVETRSERGIRLWDKLLFCASKDSLNHASIANEIDEIFANEERLKMVRGVRAKSFIPIDLDGFIKTEEFSNSRNQEIRSRVAVNFSGWKENERKFEDEFEKIIQILSLNSVDDKSDGTEAKTNTGSHAPTVSKLADSSLQSTTASELLANTDDLESAGVGNSPPGHIASKSVDAAAIKDKQPVDSLGIVEEFDHETDGSGAEESNRDTEADVASMLEDPLSRLGELAGTGDELRSGFSRLISNDGGNSLWYNYKGKKVLNHHLRQRNLDATMMWETPALPPPEDRFGSFTYFVVSGSFGAHEGVQTNGFQFLVGGVERLTFDVAREEKSWCTDDKSIVLMYSPRWMSKHDTAGFFYIAVANEQLPLDGPMQFGVRSKGSGSSRWFGLFPSTDPVRLQAEDTPASNR